MAKVDVTYTPTGEERTNCTNLTRDMIGESYSSTPEVNYSGNGEKSKQIDWEERRYDIAKEVSVGYLLMFHLHQMNNSPQMKQELTPEKLSSMSIKYADTLIEKLQKEKEEV